MHILSVEDIEFLVTSTNGKKILVDSENRKKQIDQLIRMGYVRPFSGSFVLTELGEKTAKALQIKLYVPEETIAISSDAPAEIPAAEITQ